MKIVYFGKGKRGKLCLEEIIKFNFNVVALVVDSIEDECYSYAKKKGIKILIPKFINSNDTEIKLKNLKSDLFILSGYNKIIKKNIINIPKITTINLHGGALPSYRGAAPINWQIINGEKEGGCCIIEVDEGIDTGPILIQKKFQITFEDTHLSVLDKTLKIFPEILVEVLSNIKKYLFNKRVQLLDQGSYFNRRNSEDSKINWQLTDIEIYNLIRGMNGPYQWAFSYLDNKKIEFKSAKIISNNSYGEPGKVSKITNDGVLINCKNKALFVKEIRINNNEKKAQYFFNINQQLI